MIVSLLVECGFFIADIFKSFSLYLKNMISGKDLLKILMIKLTKRSIVIASIIGTVLLAGILLSSLNPICLILIKFLAAFLVSGGVSWLTSKLEAWFLKKIEKKGFKDRILRYCLK